MRRTWARVGAALLAGMLMSAGKFDCKEKLEVALMCDPSPQGPLLFGLQDLVAAMKETNLVPRYVQPGGKKVEARYLLVVGVAGRSVWVEPYMTAAKLAVPAKPESFAAGEYSRKDRRTVVLVGSDPVGAMYGLQDLAEMVSRGEVDPTKSLKRVAKSPSIEVRGVNPFLSLPAAEDRDWWFLSEEFWRGYLDLLGRSRINFLDLHGMYDVVKTNFPNIYPYFVKSKRYPEIGAPRDEAARNLAMLNKVILMAKDRGIRVGLMSYSAGWKVPGGGNPMRHETEEALADYTRESVRQIIDACPDLAVVGFRVGESGRKEDFYKKSYLPGIGEAGRKVGLYTRTWGAKPESISEIAQAYKGRFDVEIKFNGEQLGAPYIVAGGRMAGWRDYSYQTYLGWPHSYRVLWQIRANGTHRIFHWGDPEFVRRTVRSCPLGGAAGFVVEPMNAYFPQRDYFHLRSAGHDYFKWIYERDWFWNMLWGRLAYDPDTADSVWIGEFARRFGERGGPRVFSLVCEMSQVVPLIYQSHCLGPDHRNMACELETGGDVAQFAKGQPFDTFVMQPTEEFVAREVIGRPSAKMSPLDAAAALETVSKRVLGRCEAIRGDVESGQKEFGCIAMDAQALAHLAQYYAEKLRAGTAYAFYEATGDLTQLDEAALRVGLAKAAWKRLADVTGRHYRPFLDTLRMHSVAFHWQTEGAKLEKDSAILQEARKRFEESVPSADDPAVLGHTPIRRVLTGKTFDLTATIATRSTKVYAILNYRQGPGKFTAVRLFKRKEAEYLYDTHIGSSLTPGKRYEYFIEVSYGKKFLRFPPRGDQDPFVILFTDDKQGPAIEIKQAVLTDKGPGVKELTVAARVTDKGRVDKVLLWRKPMPSEWDWRSTPMLAKGGQYVARTPVGSEGLLYAIEALDDSGNGSRYPDFRNERPYLVVEPWPAPRTPTAEDPTGFNEIARRDLSPEGYAAMLVGAQAKAFNGLPAASKKMLLDVVAGGLPLLIFSQNAPKEFDFSWLPGRIGATGEAARACKLTGTGAILENVPREIRIPWANPTIVSSALSGGEKEWKFYSEPKALAVCKLDKGMVVLCQVRSLDLLHSIPAYRLFENLLKTAAGERLGKPFVVMDKGNGRLLDALEMAGQPCVMLNEVPLLAQPRVQPAPPAEPPKPAPAPSRSKRASAKGQ